jgi:UTP-glucose-1-phosphate uridylyltransferase
MVRAVRLTSAEKRYDIGDHQAYFKTFIDYAVSDPEWGPEIFTYIQGKLAEVEEVEIVEK